MLVLSVGGSISNIPKEGSNKVQKKQRLTTGNKMSRRPGNLKLGRLILGLGFADILS